MSSASSALELARRVRYDLALLDHAPPGAAVVQLAQGLVDGSLPDHRTHVVLVAAPGKLDEARALVGKAVDAVLSATASAGAFARVLHEILGAAPRVGVRVCVRLEVSLQEGLPSSSDRPRTGPVQGTTAGASPPRARR